MHQYLSFMLYCNIVKFEMMLLNILFLYLLGNKHKWKSVHWFLQWNWTHRSFIILFTNSLYFSFLLIICSFHYMLSHSKKVVAINWTRAVEMTPNFFLCRLFPILSHIFGLFARGLIRRKLCRMNPLFQILLDILVHFWLIDSIKFEVRTTLNNFKYVNRVNTTFY